jgi:hypothetical protein
VTDRGVEQLAAGEAVRQRGRVRGFVARRSGTQRLGAVAAVLVVLSAPFGGWRSASDEDVVPLALHQRIDLGPFYLRIDGVKQVSDLLPVLQADPASRYLVIKATVTNHSDRAESADLASAAFAGEHTGFLPWPDGDTRQLHVYDVDDAVELPAGEFINPDVTYHLAFVLRQGPDTDLDALTLAVRGYRFQEVDPQTLDPDRWVLDEDPLAAGHVPVEVGT